MEYLRDDGDVREKNTFPTIDQSNHGFTGNLVQFATDK
jgi:hypothetical protein